MKSTYYIFLTFSIILLFSNCEEEISPGNPTNPTGLSNYFIPDCDSMRVDIEFFNATDLYNEDNGQYFSIDGVQSWNSMCSQYIDETAMIAAGLTYVDIWTSTVVPTEYGSRAKLQYADPSNPTLEIGITNDDSPSEGYWSDDFSLNIVVPDILALESSQNSATSTPFSYNSNWVGPNMVYNEMYQATYDIEFDPISTLLPNGGIDVANKTFQGKMVITFDKLTVSDINGNIVDHHTYYSQTPFEAHVTYFRFICE